MPVTDAIPAATLRRSLNTLANQTVNGFDVLVVNVCGAETGGLLEQTLDEYSEYFSGRVVHAEPSAGEGTPPLVAALEVAFAAIESELVCFLPAGQCYYTFHVEAMVDRLRTHPVIISGFAWTDSTGATQAAPHTLEPEQQFVMPTFPMIAWALQQRCLRTAPRLHRGVALSFWDWTLQLLLHYRPVGHRYTTCDAGTGHATSHSAEHLEEVHVRHRAWERRLYSRRAAALRETPGKERRAPLRLARGMRKVALRAYRSLVPEQRRIRFKAARRRFNEKLQRRRGFDRVQATRQAVPPHVPPRPGTKERYDLVMFGINPWQDLYQRPQHIAHGFARKHRVFYIDITFHSDETPWWDGTELPEVEPGIYHVQLPSRYANIYAPQMHALDLDTEPMVVALQQLRAVYALEDVVAMVVAPEWTPLVQQVQQAFDWLLVYDCLDNHDAFADVYKKIGIRHEPELVKDADLVVTTAQALQERWQEHARTATLIQNACDYSLFSGATSAGQLAHLEAPILGYYGSIGTRLDLPLLQEAATRRPEWQFVFVGRSAFPDKPDAWWDFTRLPNVHVFPAVDQPELAEFLAQFDLCLIPFVDNPMTRSMNFVKLYEYLAGGKPVLSANLTEVRPFAKNGLAHLFSDATSFIQRAEELLATPPPREPLQAFASEQTWQHRVSAIQSAIDEVRRGSA